MKRIHLKIHGQVQGVLFRHYTIKTASSLGLTGYAKNLPDGTVEVVAEGDEKELNELIEFCKHGPPSAHVTNIDVKFEDFKDEFDVFEVRY